MAFVVDTSMRDRATILAAARDHTCDLRDEI